MQINDVRRNIVGQWNDAAAFWQDDMSKKYKSAIINEIDSLLETMQNSCDQLMLAREDVLKRLEKYKNEAKSDG